MIKKIFFGFFLITTHLCFSQTEKDDVYYKSSSKIIPAHFKEGKHYYNEDDLPCDSAEAKYVKWINYTDTVKRSGVIIFERLNGTLISKSNYSNIVEGTEEGTTTSYYENGKMKSQINFRKGVYHGELTSYYPEGELKRREFYSKGKFKSGKCFTRDGKDTTYYPFQIMPQFPGGESALVNFIQHNLKYPPEARLKGVQGRVVVAFVIDSIGNIEKIRILRSVSPELDQEALRVVDIMTQKPWTPGYQDGEPVRVKYNLPINFTLR